MKNCNNFNIYILKLLQSISKKSITLNAKNQLNNFLIILTKEISKLLYELIISLKKKIITEKEINIVIYVLFDTILYEKSIIKAQETIIKYKLNSNNKNILRQTKAGLIFSVSTIEHIMREFNNKLSHNSIIYLTSIIETITTFILVESIKYLKYRVRIKINDIELSRNNNSIEKLFNKLNIYFTCIHSKSYIHPNIIKNSSFSVIQSIKKIQLNQELIIPKLTFEKIIRYKLQGIVISKQIFIILQQFIEKYIITILSKINLLCNHSKRTTLMVSDIELFFLVKNNI
jgi:histone H3/H4